MKNKDYTALLESTIKVARQRYILEQNRVRKLEWYSFMTQCKIKLHKAKKGLTVINNTEYNDTCAPTTKVTITKEERHLVCINGVVCPGGSYD